MQVEPFNDRSISSIVTMAQADQTLLLEQNAGAGDQTDNIKQIIMSVLSYEVMYMKREKKTYHSYDLMENESEIFFGAKRLY